jgi:phage shock protein E
MVAERKCMNWTFWILIAAGILGFLLLKRTTLVATDKARELLRQGAVVVDVRSPGEYNSGHLPGAINVPLENLRSEAPSRLPDKGQAVLLHCLSGVRSGIARRQLKKLGYTNVFNLGSFSRARALSDSRE